MRRGSWRNRIVVLVATVACIVGLERLGALKPVHWLWGHTVAPIGGLIAGGGQDVGQTLTNWTRIKDLAVENSRLEFENANLRQRLAADAETQRDNEILRRELGLAAASVIRQVNAEVVAAAPDSYRQYVWINKGSSENLKNGYAVMSAGSLIGVLSEVQTHAARVTLVSDPDFRLAAKDQDTNAAGILIGQLGGGLVLEKIGQSDSVKPGDTVTTSGLGGEVPAGLYIGQIESVDAKSDVVFQSARLVSMVRPRDLRFVAVVLP